MSYELVHKPTFSTQLLAINKADVRRVLERIEPLRDNPAPDAKNKKAVKGHKHLFRLRVGEYRVIYSFGPGYVTLIGIDTRGDVYDDVPAAAAPSFDLAALVETAESDRGTAPDEQWAGKRRPKDAADDLPYRLTAEFLHQIRIPAEDVAALVGCKTLDGLTEAAVSEWSRERVFDVVATPDYEWVLDMQPSFVTGDTDDLLKFAQGELIEFLLKLDLEQESLVRRALRGQGPMLVKGGPGTGKSTVALYRVRELIAALRAHGIAEPRILFTTYTTALISSSRQLLRRLLGDDADLVEVRTADSLCRQLVEQDRGTPQIPDAAAVRATLHQAIVETPFAGNALKRQQQARTLDRLGPGYLLEEIGAVIDGRALADLPGYLAASRAGRGVPLNATQREAVWRVSETFHHLLGQRGALTWQMLRRMAAEIAAQSQTRYDAVVIDEAQDLDPVTLRALVELTSSPDRIFVTADASQSIYGSGFRWSDIHDALDFRGRTSILRRNYRSTPQIDRAARSYLDDAALDVMEATAETTYVRQDGVMPVVRAVSSSYDQMQLLHRFVRQATRAYRMGIGGCAILVPTEEAGKSVAASLNGEGLAAEFMPGRELDLEKPVVKVLTLKSAKGLEFPIVALAGFDARTYPGVPNTATDEELDEALLRERRTMYVGMTRAMLALLVAVPSAPKQPAASLYAGFDAGSWNTGDATEGAA